MAPSRKSKSVSKRYSYASDVASKKKGENADKSGQRVSSGFVQGLIPFKLYQNKWGFLRVV